MPKLTKDLLEKRFSCQYCGESFRTRQGLSGHVYFKHGGKHKHEPLDLTLTADEAINLKLMKEILGPQSVSTSTLYAFSDMVAWWHVVRLVCRVFHIELNQQDLKNYLITSLVQIHQSERLKQDMIETLGSLTKN